jgi:diguanylate cyclase (GGDEF)-like protein
MGNYLFWIATGLVIESMIMLAMSLVPVRSIIHQLPDGTIRTRWKVLTGLIIMFIGGYGAYALLHGPGVITSVSDLIVPGIFSCGAIFVYLVCSLSLTTALDLRQMYILQQESITDPLTGMYNRRYLDHRMVKEFQRAMRFEQPFSIFLLDIDYFKKVNDAYGHQIGDMVLSKLGQLIMHSVREVDIVIRYGGEEILVILPNTTAVDAFNLAERIRKQVEETIMVASDCRAGYPAVRITVSIGVSEYQFSDGWDNARNVTERADKAMYMAKAQGRNRVVRSGPNEGQC